MDTLKKLPSQVVDMLPERAHDLPRVAATRMAASRPINVGKTERAVSVISGGSLLIAGTRRGGMSGGLMTLLGAILIGRGAGGYCPVSAALGRDTAGPRAPHASVDGTFATRVDHAIVINRPVHDVYEAWRGFAAFPTFMKHLERVTVLDDRRSHWVAKGPLGYEVEWDAEIVNQEEDRVIAWRSLPDACIDHAGSARFRIAPGGRGTEVCVTLEYHAPAGIVGRTLAKLFGEEPEGQIREDLRRFKSIVETGEVASVEGQSHGARV
jgi:uncharacterized membrane protein